jgi:plastocyanin
MRMPFTQSLGTLAVAVVLISHRPASAQPTVHEVQIAASKYQFTPSTIQVTAGERFA